jgi:hypothetical protein
VASSRRVRQWQERQCPLDCCHAAHRHSEDPPGSPEILEKPSRLAAGEYAEIQRHAIFGARLVASLGDPELTAMVRHHHERLDGSGYPDRLHGDAIPLLLDEAGQTLDRDVAVAFAS